MPACSQQHRCSLQSQTGLVRDQTSPRSLFLPQVCDKLCLQLETCTGRCHLHAGLYLETNQENPTQTLSQSIIEGEKRLLAGRQCMPCWPR